MKNWEKYEERLKEIGTCFAATKDGTVDECARTNCSVCTFYNLDISCELSRIKWLYQDYIEEPKLTKRERMFCELMQTGWIAKNQNGIVWIFSNKPHKVRDDWFGHSITRATEWFKLNFDSIKWEDEEPWTVEDLLKLEVEDE